MIGSSRLHRGTGRFRHGVNSIPNVMRFTSDDFTPHLKHKNYVAPQEEPETVYVNMKIDSEEDLETKYVQLFIDTKRNVSKLFKRNALYFFYLVVNSGMITLLFHLFRWKF